MKVYVLNGLSRTCPALRLLETKGSEHRGEMLVMAASEALIS